jgi:DtxR family transcriptional regulator, Mn-dependent transcriptional regulator
MTQSTDFTCDGGCCAIDRSPTVEDYLKTLFALTSSERAASTSAVAERLGVAASSASAMVARLRGAGLVEQAGWGRVRLTGHGMAHARSVVRRHRLLETFLHRVLGMSWDEVHDEAEVLEHHLSHRVENLIDAALGFPDRDPHGDPIPGVTGPHDEHAETPLARTGAGDVFLVQRVFDSDSASLRHLARLGIRPGSALEVGTRASDTAPLWVRVGTTGCPLAPALVGLIHGRVLETGVAS